MFKNQKGIAHILILLAVVGLLAFLLISNTFGFKDKLFNTLFPKPSSNAQEPKYIPGEVLIQFKVGASEDAKVQARGRVQATQKKLLKKGQPLVTTHTKEDSEKPPQNPRNGDLEIDTIPSGQSIDDVIANLQQDPNVAFVLPNIEGNE